MPPERHETLKEILTQTAAWEDAIRVVDEKAETIRGIDLSNYRHILTIGCGSTHYLSMTAANLIQSMTGSAVRALPSSEMLLFPESYRYTGKTLLVAISRSGSTSETYSVIKAFKQDDQGDVIVVTNYPESPMVSECDIVLSIREGQEISVAQTRSFASMLVAVNAMAYLLKSGQSFSQFKDALVSCGNNIIKNYQPLAQQLGNDRAIKQVFFLGSGSHYGLACEASLKLKEMSQMVCEPFHFLEFRHGPISMVDENTLVVGLVSEKAFDFEIAVIEDVRKLGARTLTLGERNLDINFSSGLPETTRDVLYLPILQLFAYYRAVSFGKNPDGPRNLTAVVKLDID